MVPDCSQEPQQLRPKSQQPRLWKVSQASQSQGLAEERPDCKAHSAQGAAAPAPAAFRALCLSAADKRLSWEGEVGFRENWMAITSKDRKEMGSSENLIL